MSASSTRRLALSKVSRGQLANLIQSKAGREEDVKALATIPGSRNGKLVPCRALY